MTPLFGNPSVWVVPLLLTYSWLPLMRMIVRPLNTYPSSCATLRSVVFVVGAFIAAEPGRCTPCHCGLLVAQLPDFTVSLVFGTSSILSSLLRPKIGESQISRLSLLCSGPLTLSPLTNWISGHVYPVGGGPEGLAAGRCQRYRSLQ